MLRISASLRAPFRLAGVRSYADGGFEISDYLNRIEAITKSRKPQARGGPTQGKKVQAQQKPQQRQSNQNSQQRSQQRPQQRPQRSQQRAPRGTRVGNDGQSGVRASGTNGVAPQSRANSRPGAQRSNVNRPRDSAKDPSAARQAATRPVAAKPAAVDSSSSVRFEGFTPLSSVSQEPLPKAGRRASAASRAPRTRPKRGKKTGSRSISAPRPDRRIQATEQDTSFLRPKDALNIILRNQNTTVNGFVGVPDVSLQSLQPNIVSSAVSYNSRVRSLLRNLPEDVLADRNQLNALVRKHVEGSYDDVVIEAKGGNVSSESLTKILNANPTFTGETKQFLANIGSGKIPIKQIARAN